MRSPIILLCALALPLLSCGEPERIAKESEEPRARPERVEQPELVPPARPVRIGEGGPRFAACQAIGEVKPVAGDSLPLLDAPFVDATAKGSVQAGAKLFICTRSIDQQWLGVVVPGDAAETCGVTAPVRSKRDYDGPCPSGWVDSSLVQLVAD